MATYSFLGPVVWEGKPLPPSTWWYLKAIRMPRGVSLYLEDGTYKETRGVQESMYRNKVDGVDYFIGGMHYSGVPQDVADVLIASGYGDNLELEP